MEQITSLFHLDSPTFSEWVSAEKRRLPGASDGFARFLALVRMVRPAQVVWISDGQEAAACGYDGTNIARIIVDMLGFGSQLMWARAEGGTKPEEVAYISGLGGDDAASGFTVICAPEGYEVVLHLPKARISGAHVVRSSSEWRFMRIETVEVEVSGGGEEQSDEQSGGDRSVESGDESGRRSSRRRKR